MTPLPDEPLADSAPLARRLAAEHCGTGAPPGESCAWYHGFWQYLRLLGLATTGRMSFIAAHLRLLARSGGYSRLLISGAADYAVAAHAAWAYRQERATAAITMVDRCETPLALTRWYGDRYDIPVTACRADILDFEGAARYDVVATNCFLGNFDPPARARLFGRWARLLRPGGRLILTNRVRPGEGHARVAFTPGQAEAFVSLVRAEAGRTRTQPAVEPDEMARLARVFAERSLTVPLRSTADLAALIESGGFDVEHMDTAPEAGRARGAAVTGPKLAEATGYVGAVAIRR